MRSENLTQFKNMHIIIVMSYITSNLDATVFISPHYFPELQLAPIAINQISRESNTDIDKLKFEHMNALAR